MADHCKSRRTSPPSPAAAIALGSASEEVRVIDGSTCMLVPKALGCVTAEVFVTVNGTSAVLTGVVMCREYQPAPTLGSVKDAGPLAVLHDPVLSCTPLMSDAFHFTTDAGGGGAGAAAPPAGDAGGGAGPARARGAV